MDKKTEIFRVLFSVCAGIGVYIAGYLLALVLLTGIPFLNGLSVMYINGIAMAAAALVVLPFIKKEEVGLRMQGKIIWKIMAVAAMAYSASVLFNVLLGLIPWGSMFEGDVTPDEAVYFGIPLWARMICYEIIAPVSEEILFRQIIFKRLRSISPLWVAALVSALFFGLYHGNLVQGIYAFIMGLFLALMYEWIGSLLAPVLFHMIANHVSDITYEFEQWGKVVYSVPGTILSAVVILLCICFFIKNKNKCSEK